MEKIKNKEIKMQKKNIKWINFLHMYQPANADSEKIIEASEKSYYRIIRGLEENPDIRFTININGCLVLRWLEIGEKEIIEKIKRLIKKGQIELTGSAAYHPLLPLVGKKEAKKQIKENEKIFKKYFDYKPKGFFFPEMAYGSKIAELVKEMGYEWIILDEISKKGKILNKNKKESYKNIFDFLRACYSRATIDKNSGLKVIFRSREISNTYVPEFLNNIFKKIDQEKIDNEINIITGTDGELIGLRHEDPTGEFEKIIKNKKIKTLTISEYLNKRKNLKEVKIVNSNWESTESELWLMRPYALWENSGNGIQRRIWKLAKLASKTIEENKEDDNYKWARWHLVRGLASCTFWWASGKDFSHIYGPKAWNPDEIEKGIRELIRAIRSIENVKTRKIKINAEKLYLRIKQIIWSEHWEKHWKR
jgi:alpha-amylase/alpha-mannosidase (GH57 family)